jgi:hypothetical protein
MTELEALAWCQEHQAMIEFRTDAVVLFTSQLGGFAARTFLDAVIMAQRAENRDEAIAP